jgi:hypothetical protein
MRMWVSWPVSLQAMTSVLSQLAVGEVATLAS